MVRHLPAPFVSFVVALSTMTGVSVSTSMVAEAQAGYVIKKSDFDYRGHAETRYRCAREQYMTFRGVPIQVAKCTDPRTWCMVGVPLKRNVGLCVGFYAEKSIVATMQDKMCDGVMYFKKEAGRIRRMSQKSDWQCRYGHYTPLSQRISKSCGPRICVTNVSLMCNRLSCLGTRTAGTKVSRL